MSRLIDADRLLFDMSNAFAELRIGKREILREDDILKMIYNAPVAEEHPVKHGRWETEVRTNRDGTRSCVYACSLCGNMALDVFKYCPNCGGRNEVDENDCY